MSSQITPEQVELLLTLAAVILVAVVMRLVGLAILRKWFTDAPDDNLTQEERDERLVARRRRPR